MSSASKIRLESNWYVSSKCLTSTLEIKVASAGHLKCKLYVSDTSQIKLESTWGVSSVDMFCFKSLAMKDTINLQKCLFY